MKKSVFFISALIVSAIAAICFLDFKPKNNDKIIFFPMMDGDVLLPNLPNQPIEESIAQCKPEEKYTWQKKYEKLYGVKPDVPIYLIRSDQEIVVDYLSEQSCVGGMCGGSNLALTLNQFKNKSGWEVDAEKNKYKAAISYDNFKKIKPLKFTTKELETLDCQQIIRQSEAVKGAHNLPPVCKEYSIQHPNIMLDFRIVKHSIASDTEGCIGEDKIYFQIKNKEAWNSDWHIISHDNPIFAWLDQENTPYILWDNWGLHTMKIINLSYEWREDYENNFEGCCGC